MDPMTWIPPFFLSTRNSIPCSKCKSSCLGITSIIISRNSCVSPHARVSDGDNLRESVGIETVLAGRSRQPKGLGEWNGDIIGRFLVPMPNIWYQSL